ncbi:MAG: PilZ domain-containing protein [Acidimicrobiales bacterium]|jgi:hypothetical protein
MIYQLRRFLPRQFADWEGTYLVEADPEMRWRDCRVVDISSAGAGVELIDPPAGVTEGNRIFISVHLQAEIRHTTEARGERLRVGAQFVELSEAERAYMAELNQLQARW